MALLIVIGIIIIIGVCLATYFFTKKVALKELYFKNEELKKELHQKTKELDRILHKQNKFWSVVTHELKNVFYSFYNSIDLLNTEYEDLDEEERKTLIQNIGNSYNYTLSMINDLMEWSKVNRQLREPSPETFNLRVLVDELILNLQDGFSNKNLNLLSKIESDIPVFADRLMTGFIIKNLLSNARKFSNKDNTITISSTSTNKFVELCVEDQGIGIPKDNFDRLFNLDEIFSTIGTNREKGTGLGLLICKDFIELNGGTINVKSEEGKGTSVSITIPHGNF